MNHRSSTAMTRQVIYLAYALGAAIPVFIGLYWPLYWVFPYKTPHVFRPTVLVVALVLALLRSGLSISRAEVKLAQNLAVVCLTWLGTSFFATDVPRALEGWLKVAALCLAALLLSRALRNPATAKAFGWTLIASSLAIAIFITYTYVRFAGWTLPTYESSRQLKTVAFNNNIQLNGISFSALMAYVTGICAWRKTLWTRLIGVVVLIVCATLTGSRTPIAVFAISAFVLLLANRMRSRNLLHRYQAFLATAAVLVALALFLRAASFKKMSDLTEGRWDLWYVAVHKFVERPLVGHGFESVNDDLYVRLPGYYRIPKKREDAFPGGYHNQYLGTLAEEGLIGFIPVITLYWFLMRSCWQLAFRKWATWRNGQWALLGAVFLLLRAGDELPGLFGYANGLGDFQAYIFLALVVSRFSIEEDCAKHIARQFHLAGGFVSRNVLKLKLRQAVETPAS